MGIGQVAQSVEQRTENPCVGGSIPPLPTVLGPFLAKVGQKWVSQVICQDL